MKSQNQPAEEKNQKKSGKKRYFAAFFFYFWIAFEFAYMAGPFAAFFYSAYSPVLNFLNDIPALSWMTRFFLPHISRNTSSLLINLHDIVGAVLAVMGFLFFLIGACRIYYSKIRKKGAVTGGIYRYIRHPQYLSFIICSFGLLLIWPRMIVLLGFVSMLFIYYFLARAEERECSEKFGETYIQYMKTTNRFIPFGKWNREAKQLPVWKGLVLWILSLLISLGVAFGLQIFTVNSLYAVYSEHSATVAVCRMEPEQINEVKEIASSDGRVQAYLEKCGEDADFLNYVLPVSWYAAEVPMNGLKYRSGHKSPSDYPRNLYKIIFTEAEAADGSFSGGKDILKSLHSRIPLVEVWVDTDTGSVTDVYDMPTEVKYDGIPEAVY